MTYVISGTFVPNADLTPQRSIVLCIDITRFMDNSTSIPQGGTLHGRLMYSVTYLYSVKSAVLTRRRGAYSRIELTSFLSKLHVNEDTTPLLLISPPLLWGRGNTNPQLGPLSRVSVGWL
jgi:hypothetical protein